MNIKRPLPAAVAALFAFIVLRVAVLPSQLNRTPYRDDTLGEDLIRVVFLRVPIWILAVSASVFAIALWFSTKRLRAQSHHPDENKE